MSTLWPHHGHQPVYAQESDEHDRGIHVSIAQVEEQLAHGAAEHPRLHGQVDDEEYGEAHDNTVGTCQVQDDQRGDRALMGTCQDAPYDEDVSWDSQDEGDGEDGGTDSQRGRG